MFRFGTDNDDDRHLVGFVSSKAGVGGVCRNAMVLIPGLTDGFMVMAYTEHLSSELLKRDYSLVQVNLGSSFMQFGISSLKKDSEELAKLLLVLKEKFKFEKIILLGHSTGAQDSLYFLRYSDEASLVNGIVLQAAVSDRECMGTYEQTPRCLEEARRLEKEGKLSAILSETVDGAPITAERFLSLVGRLTDDDMFSTDLTSQELEPILSAVRVPVLLCFSAEDEFVPDKEAQKAFAERMVTTLKGLSQTPVVELKYLTGDHGLTKPEYYWPFIRAVCDFLSSF